MAASGAPPRDEKIEIDKEIKFYYNRNIGIMEVVERTKHTYRTVKARYKQWDKLLSNGDKIFIEEQEKSKQRALGALDKQIMELITVQQEVNTFILSLPKDASVDLKKHELRSKLAWMLFDMTDKKATLELTPAVAEKIRQEVMEYIDKFRKQSIPYESDTINR